jgi:hypothetical protein
MFENLLAKFFKASIIDKIFKKIMSLTAYFWLNLNGIIIPKK